MYDPFLINNKYKYLNIECQNIIEYSVPGDLWACNQLVYMLYSLLKKYSWTSTVLCVTGHNLKGYKPHQGKEAEYKWRHKIKRGHLQMLPRKLRWVNKDNSSTPQWVSILMEHDGQGGCRAKCFDLITQISLIYIDKFLTTKTNVTIRAQPLRGTR